MENRSYEPAREGKIPAGFILTGLITCQTGIYGKCHHICMHTYNLAGYMVVVNCGGRRPCCLTYHISMFLYIVVFGCTINSVDWGETIIKFQDPTSRAIYI